MQVFPCIHCSLPAWRLDWAQSIHCRHVDVLSHVFQPTPEYRRWGKDFIRNVTNVCWYKEAVVWIICTFVSWLWEYFQVLFSAILKHDSACTVITITVKQLVTVPRYLTDCDYCSVRCFCLVDSFQLHWCGIEILSVIIYGFRSVMLILLKSFSKIHRKGKKCSKPHFPRWELSIILCLLNINHWQEGKQNKNQCLNSPGPKCFLNFLVKIRAARLYIFLVWLLITWLPEVDMVFITF